jgi:hypothetical protein
MENLVSIEKKIFLKKENLEYWHYYCAYDLVMQLLDQSYFEQGDIKEMIEVCEFCLSDEYTYLDLAIDVNEAHIDWIENNYSYL